MIGTLIIVGCIAAMGCGKSACSSNSSPQHTPDASQTDDLKSIQGYWGVEKLEVLNEDGPFPEDVPFVYFQIEGNKGTQFYKGKVRGYFVAKIDTSKPVKEVDFIQADPDGKIEGPIKGTAPVTVKDNKPVFREEPRETLKGIYKLESDKIVVAIAGHSKLARPAEFKPTQPAAKKWALGVPMENLRSVFVLTLKKMTDEDVKKLKTN